MSKDMELHIEDADNKTSVSKFIFSKLSLKSKAQ